MRRRLCICWNALTMPKYSLEEIEALRKALLGLLATGPTNSGYGVCHNLQARPELSRRILNEEGVFEYFDAYSFVAKESIGWPHHNGDGAYFITRTEHFGLWEDENGERRVNLIHYLLGRVAWHEASHRGGVALAV